MDAINLSRVSFQYDSKGPKILDIPVFQVLAGKKVFIYGPSGSGKTTLLGLLGGLNVPTSGEVKILEKSLQKMGSRERDVFRADHIGFIFQMFNLLPYLSILENVLIPLKFSKLRKKRVLEADDSESVAKKLLLGLDLPEHLFGKPVYQLSVGQQQRVAAARALIGNPEIIIADEPTSSLDADACGSFLTMLFNQCEKTRSTLLFVSHDKRLSKSFDEVINLSEVNRS